VRLKNTSKLYTRPISEVLFVKRVVWVIYYFFVTFNGLVLSFASHHKQQPAEGWHITHRFTVPEWK